MRFSARRGRGREGRVRDARAAFVRETLTFRDCRNVGVRALHAMFSREAVLVSSSLRDTLIYQRGFWFFFHAPIITRVGIVEIWHRYRGHCFDVYIPRDVNAWFLRYKAARPDLPLVLDSVVEKTRSAKSSQGRVAGPDQCRSVSFQINRWPWWSEFSSPLHVYSIHVYSTHIYI